MSHYYHVLCSFFVFPRYKGTAAAKIVYKTTMNSQLFFDEIRGKKRILLGVTGSSPIVSEKRWIEKELTKYGGRPFHIKISSTSIFHRL